MFKPSPGKVSNTQFKAYCPISLLPFMQKMTQKLVKRNIRMKHWGISPTSIIILSFPKYCRSFTRHNKSCQMAWAWRHTIPMDWLHAGWQKSYSHSHIERLEGSVAKRCPQRGILLPHSCEAWL